MTGIESSMDLRSFIMSSDNHMLHLIDGQVMQNAREQLEKDIEEDKAIIASFLSDGGKLLVEDESTEIIFGTSYFTQYSNGNIIMRVSAVDSIEAERIDEVINALLDMHGAEAALNGGIAKICRNAANYDYLTGMDRLSKDVRDRDLGTAASIAAGTDLRGKK